ncbi:MAG: ThuA domain-containing protein [Planctomycetota bacterium]
MFEAHGTRALTRVQTLLSILILALLPACRTSPKRLALAGATDERSRKMIEAMPAEARVAPDRPRKILVFSKCEGFVHDSIPVANEAIKIMGEVTGAFLPVFSEEMSAFEPENLQAFDAVLFNNTTRLAFASPKQREALLAFVKSGKGVIGIHAASDNFYDWPEAAEMMGGLFDGHPWGAGGTWAVKIDEPDHPLNEAFSGRGFLISDEIYQLKEPYSRKTHRVLLSLDMSNPRNQKVEGIKREDGDFAISWVKRCGEGRVFYGSLGHNHEIFWNPAVLRHYLDGIQYALGDLEIDDAPSATLETAPAPALTTAQGAVDDPLVALAQYDYGQSRVILTDIEELIRQASPKERGKIEKKLLKVAASEQATLAGRQFACRMLRGIGTDRSVSVLSRLLADEELAHMARYALQGIDSPGVDKSLRKALNSLEGNLRLGVIDSVAARGDRMAVPFLTRLAEYQDEATARAAISALGRIGGAEAARSLARVRVSGKLLPVQLDARLMCADRFLAENEISDAVTIYRGIAKPENPVACRVAAWRGIVQAEPDGAAAVIAALFQDEAPELRQAAAKMLAALPANLTSRPITAKLTAFGPETQVLALGALAARRDRDAAPAAANAAANDNPAVRVAGLEALGSIGDVSHVPLLIEAVMAQEGDAARGSLMRLTGAGVDEAIQERVDSASAETRAALIPCLVKRRPEGIVKTLLLCAEDQDGAVRGESLRGLAAVTEPGQLPLLIDLLQKLGTEEDRGKLEQAILATCKRSGDGDESLRLIKETLPGKDAPVRAALLRVLGQIPSESSLAPLVAAVSDEEAEVRAAAIRALSAWPDKAPLTCLLDTAKGGGTATDRVLAMRGYLGLAGRTKEKPAEDVQSVCESVLLAAETGDDKKALIESAAAATDTWVLDFLAPLLEDAALGKTASAAHTKVCSALARMVSHDGKGCPVTLAFPHEEKYGGGGKDALTDGTWGSTNHGDGHWQGFKGKDLDATIDLGRLVEVESIRAGFLSSMNSWIFPPVEVEFSLSADGKTFRSVKLFQPKAPTSETDAALEDFYTPLNGEQARYVKVRAKNIGTCPAWHSGAGEEAWLFADEIQVNPHFQK